MTTRHNETAQNVAARALAEGHSPAEAAELADVHRRTVYRWLKEDVGFAAKRALARRLVREGAADLVEARLASMAADALEVLHATLADDDLDAGTRAKVALAIVDRLRAPEPPEGSQMADPTRAALEAAAGGPEALRAQVGAALAEAYGFGPKPAEVPASAAGEEE